MSPARGPNGPLSPPLPCTGCGVKPAAWLTPRIDFCYDCIPGGPLSNCQDLWIGVSCDVLLAS